MEKKHTYESLLQKGYTKSEIHHALYALMAAKIAYEKDLIAQKKASVPLTTVSL